jgi:hypothetical protein
VATGCDETSDGTGRISHFRRFLENSNQQRPASVEAATVLWEKITSSQSVQADACGSLQRNSELRRARDKGDKEAMTHTESPVELFELATPTGLLHFAAVRFAVPTSQERDDMQDMMKRAADHYCANDWEVAKDEDVWTLLLFYDSKLKAVSVCKELAELHDVLQVTASESVN